MEALQDPAVNIDEQRRATGQTETVSQRKLNANRQNARKSKILRYETTIERSLGRAYDRLERLQRRRKGEPVLPPLKCAADLMNCCWCVAFGP